MTICVFGAASSRIKKEYTDAVYELSLALGKAGHHLVFGAGSTGVMGASARGFKDGGGKVHGVIPQFFEDNGFENMFYEADKITRTTTMAERKTLMEDECDAFIIAPGGIGTMEEFFEVLTLKQLGRHKKAIVIYNVLGYYDNLEGLLNEMIRSGFVKEECKKIYTVLDKKEDVIEYLKNYKTDGISWNLLKTDWERDKKNK